MTVNQKRLWGCLTEALWVDGKDSKARLVSLKDFKEIWAAARAELILEWHQGKKIPEYRAFEP